MEKKEARDHRPSMAMMIVPLPHEPTVEKARFGSRWDAA